MSQHKVRSQGVTPEARGKNGNDPKTKKEKRRAEKNAKPMGENEAAKTS